MISPANLVPVDALKLFCQHHGVRRMALFGSILRQDFHETSDVDVLIEFEPEMRAGFFRFVDMQDELTELFGREVDLHTPDTLSKYFREKVLTSAQVIYERA